MVKNMGSNESYWNHPYEYDPNYSKRVAYFCMEFGIDQALKTYAGGLGFLAGSHMRSAYSLRQNLIGIGMLWKYGYYDHVRGFDRKMEIRYVEKYYAFLEDTGINLMVNVNSHKVKVKVYYLAPEIFNTVPLFFLSTDLEGNDHLARTITNHLYDANLETRIAQQIVLGVGGAKLVEIIGGADIYHMNEAHPLPLIFYLYKQNPSLEALREKVVFTTHTPEKAGNEENDIFLLNRLGYFSGTDLSEIRKITNTTSDTFSHTHAALRLVKATNAVSRLHEAVSEKMWNSMGEKFDIIPITNSQDSKYWCDKRLWEYHKSEDIERLKQRKRELKMLLIDEIADQCGKMFDPDVLTIVWARRFAEYKRPALVLYNIEKFNKIFSNTDKPVQMIWAGKPYPQDGGAVSVFNNLIDFAFKRKNCAVLMGYELKLSKLLKQGSDVWLNNPRLTREASGTSGMTAAMNATLNFSIPDGWIPEFGRHGENSFILPAIDYNLPKMEQDKLDSDNIYQMLQEEIIPTYYEHNDKWWQMVKSSMNDVVPKFDSLRMAAQYYDLMYNPAYIEYYIEAVGH